MDRHPTRLGRLLVAAGALLFAAPALLMLLGSLRGRGLPPPRGLEIVPSDPGLGAYRAVLDLLPWQTYLTNSLVVVAFAVPLTVLVASLAGFGIRLLRPRARRWMVLLVVVAMLVPVTAVWATRFELFRLLGIVDTPLPLVSLGLVATNPFYVLVYLWGFQQVDDEQLEAARLDGAGPLRLWRSIGMPQVGAMTLAVAVLSFTFHWADFLDALLYLNSASRFTAPLGLRLLQQLNPTDWPLLTAGSVLLSLPVVTVFLVGQRWFLHDPLRRLERT